MALTLPFHSGPDYDCVGLQTAPLPVDITPMICVYMCNFYIKRFASFSIQSFLRDAVFCRGTGGRRRRGAAPPVFRE